MLYRDSRSQGQLCTDEGHQGTRLADSVADKMIIFFSYFL